MQKLYVLIRKYISPEYQAVQGGHAIAEFLLNHPNQKWLNEILVYLHVKNENILKKWIMKLKFNDFPLSYFQEPDLNNEITALATLAPPNIFKNLNLLTF